MMQMVRSQDQAGKRRYYESKNKEKKFLTSFKLLGYFSHNPTSLQSQSEYVDEVEKLLSLPRILEKKRWNPTKTRYL